MRVFIWFSIAIGLSVVQVSPAKALEAQHEQLHQHLTTEKMQTLRVMISKLRDLVFNLRDINKLEEIGMPHRDVVLMKQALEEKIKQMQSETVAFIRRL